MANITAATVDALQTSIGGKVSQPGEAGYDEAVNIWNGAITRRPAVVASCASSSDVAAAFAFARREGLEVSVRGGGHNYAGFALHRRRADDRPDPDEGRHASTRTRGGRRAAAARRGASSTPRPRSTVSPCPAASSATPASPA